MTTELIIPIKAETKELFTAAGIDTILKAMDAKIEEFDITSTETKKDRDQIISFAAKIVKTKTFLEKAGKAFVADRKADIKIFDVGRKRLRESLAEKAAEVRKPVTIYEDAEKIRIEKERQHEIYLIEWDEAITEDDIFNREKVLVEKEAAIAKLEKEKRQKEESARIKKEQEGRDERIKKEAAEKAVREAEEKLERERAESARKEAAAKEAIEQAELDRISAGKKAEDDKQAAIQKVEDDAKEEAQRKEQQRLDRKAAEEKKRLEEKRIAEKKAANLNHQRAVNNRIINALTMLGIPKSDSKKIIVAIVRGEVPNIVIDY